jgi:glutamate-ammonia-ligase adenylyltransferase
MQLRPSGSKGPVAVRVSGFAHYYAHEAWTWELLALTRARVAAGDAALAARVMDAVRAVIASPRAPDAVIAEAADMRARMDRERPGKGIWDLKLNPGGLVDVEFVAQALSIGATPHANTGEALDALAVAGRLPVAEAALLRAAWTLYSDLQQVLRVCVDDTFEPAKAPERLKALLARVGRCDTFDALETRLREVMAGVRAIFASAIAGPRDGTGAIGR